MNVEMRGWIGRWTSATLGLALAIPSGLGADGQPGTEPLPIKRFECGMVVATCFSRGQVLNDGNTAQCLPRPSLPEGYVVGIMDLRNPAGNGATPLANWLPPMTHNETGAPQHQWRASNLGEVFGIALDNQSPPNIYVAATSIYPGEYYPSTGGPGSVYRIDGTTFQISTLITFKNVGSVSLGNLCFDPDHNQLLVADLDNGLIRRVSMTGVELSTFDHGVSGRASASLPVIPDSSPFQRLTDAGRRVFAVQYHQGRVYYSVWGNVTGAGPGPGANTIWSVALLPNGDFATGPNAARVEVTPAQLAWNPSTGVTLAPNPATQASVVTDIAFSADGRMGTAERGLCFDDTRNLNTFAHYSPAREFVPAGTGWTDVTAPNGMRIGNSNPGHNSEGGLDYDCLRQVYVTGDLYVPNAPNPPYIYGVQILPSATNAFNTSYLVDLDGDVGNYDKSYLGDVEVYRCCDCVKFTAETVQCLPGNQFQWTFCMTNTGTLTNGHLVFLDLPPGVTVSPAIVDLVPPVKPGQGICTNVVFTLPAGMEPGELCFRVAVHTPDYSDCCVVTKCLKLSSCCAAIKEEKVICSQDGSGNLVWNFTLQNISGQPIKYVYLDAQPGCITPKFQVLTLNPPLANNQTLTTNITFASTNRCPEVCFRVSLHDSNIVNCCTFRHCVKLPDCVGVTDVVKPGELLPDELKISPDSPTILTTLAPVNIPLSLLPSQADVKEVALLVDGVRVAQTTTPAKSLRLGTLRPGVYELTLETTDGSGATRLSAPMMLLVQPELTPGILEAESVTGGVELRIQTIAGETCWVESATSLEPENWKTEETLTGDGKVRRQKVSFNDGKARFFRVRMQ